MSEVKAGPTQRWLRSRLALLLAGFLAMTFGCVIGYWVHKPPSQPNISSLTQPSVVDPYKPQNDQERKLFAGLQPAGDDLNVTLVSFASQQMPFSPIWPVYVATRDLVLPDKPLGRSMIIAVPRGIKWVAGPLNNIVLDFAAELFDDPNLQLVNGSLVFDPLCHAPSIEVDVSLCGNVKTQQPPAQMDLRYLRKLSDKEQGSSQIEPILRSVYRHSSAGVYIATGPVVLKPDFTAGGRGAVIILDTDHGGRIAGGRLGWNQVVTLKDMGVIKPDYWYLADPMYDSARYGSADSLCRHFSQQVQSQYYPGIC